MKHKRWCGRWKFFGPKGPPVLVFTLVRPIVHEET